MRCDCIGVDTEGDSLFSYKEQVSLIQISGNDKNYIFDPLLLDTVHPLALLFENRTILKIFHGSDYDVVSLKRDFQFEIRPIFDTALAARAIGMKQFSLQRLIEIYFQVRLVKKYQKANWKLRPLSKEQLDYASLDTAYLISLYKILSAEVEKKGRSDQIEEECRLMEEITWSGKDFEPNDYIRIKGARALSEPAQKILRALIAARDRLASERNYPPFKVISSRHLILMAEHAPQDKAELMRLFPKKNTAVIKYCDRWLAAIQAGLTSKAPLPERVKSHNGPLTTSQEKLLKSLKIWRNKQAEEEGLEPAMVLTSNVLKEIAREKPKTIAALESIPLIRTWQIKRYGLPLLQSIRQKANRSNGNTPNPA